MIVFINTLSPTVKHIAHWSQRQIGTLGRHIEVSRIIITDTDIVIPHVVALQCETKYSYGIVHVKECGTIGERSVLNQGAQMCAWLEESFRTQNKSVE